MQPFDLLGITIKSLAEIEKEVSLPDSGTAHSSRVPVRPPGLCSRKDGCKSPSEGKTLHAGLMGALLGLSLFRGQHQSVHPVYAEKTASHMLLPELLREEHLSQRWKWQNHFNILGSLGLSRMYPASRSRLHY